jgi:hypothetical protein
MAIALRGLWGGNITGSFGDFMEKKKINKIKRQKLVRVEAHN